VTVGNVAGVVVGLVLLMAGATKIFDKTWREREGGHGTPAWLLPLVPPVEMVLGALVAVRIARPVVGLAAMLLLIVFTIFLVVKWDERSGEPCNCFGSWSKRPTSAWTIVRNLALIALALAAAFFD
jgi:uncharacterized membrane protein YphA (DoxX/SURF4 family)